MSQQSRTAAATEANRRLAAERAIDDPRKLSTAVRIVRTAVSPGRLSISDLLPTGPEAAVELRSAGTGRAHG